MTRLVGSDWLAAHATAPGAYVMGFVGSDWLAAHATAPRGHVMGLVGFDWEDRSRVSS